MLAKACSIGIRKFMASARSNPVGRAPNALARHEAGMRFTITTGRGHTVAIDDAEGDSAPRPAELLLAAQAGCTALNVASILAKKRQSFSSYEVAVTGDQRQDRHPRVYQRIEIAHEFGGKDLGVAAVRRAIELSATRDCTTSAMFSAGPAEIHRRYIVLRGDGRPAEGGEVVVIGPGGDPDALGEQWLASNRIAAIAAG
jgi:putative redox protein